VYRPLIGGPLLCLMVVCMCLVVYWRGDQVELDTGSENFGKKKKKGGCPECHGAGCDFCKDNPMYAIPQMPV